MRLSFSKLTYCEDQTNAPTSCWPSCFLRSSSTHNWFDQHEPCWVQIEDYQMLSLHHICFSFCIIIVHLILCNCLLESSHGQALYGGRMTEDRLRAVYNATTDAINQIHKSLESCPTEETVADDPAGLRVSCEKERPLF